MPPVPSDDTVAECRDLVVRYGDRTAVDGLSLTVQRGRIVALLGPNGAGKTSTVETLEGYRRPAAGTVRVLGLDPAADKARLVPRIGVMLQRGGVYPTMGPRRVLELFARYYDDPAEPAVLLERLGLTAVARTPWRRLSGGEQQRLALALALVGKPEVLFLDEPTAGVDPEGRLAVRDVIDEQRRCGVAVLLTTHELNEAERLADEVVIIAAGRCVARGSVADLGRGGQSIRFTSAPAIDIAALAESVGTAPADVREVAPGTYVVDGPATAARVAAVAGFLERAGLPMEDLQAGRASLEDIYLSVLGAESGATGATSASAETAETAATGGRRGER